MTGRTTATANRGGGEVPSYGWLLGMSAWILLTAIPQSATAWLGFLIVGIIARRLSWGVIGVIAGACAILAHLPIWGQFRPIAVLLVYLAGMLGALWLNPAWLRTMWERRVSRAAAAAPPAAPPRTASVERGSTKRRRAKRSGTTAVAATQQVARQAARQGSARPSGPATAEPAESVSQRLADRAGASTDGLLADPSPAETGEPVDVNAATAAELARLPGFTRSRAQTAVRLRNREGRYASLEDFAERLRLQPHEIVRLRDRLVCSPPPRGPRSFGRRVDY